MKKCRSGWENMGNNVYIIEGARTPFGTFGGALKDISAVDLGVISAKAAIERSGISAAAVDDVVYGNVIHTSKNASYLARHIALHSGVPVSVPALTVNRLCGSGLQAVVSAALSIKAGETRTALVGGTENMSMSPYATFSNRFEGKKMGGLNFEDMLLHTLTDQYCGTGMGITAENLAQKYGISRNEQDEFALLSQGRAEEARLAGKLAEEIVPVEVKQKMGSISIVKEDEHPKRDTSLDGLAKLKPAFKKDGTVTAGTSSGINDGAASLVIANEEIASKHDKTPLAKIIAWGIAGVDPSIMGIGPVPAIRNALERAKLNLSEIDVIEINEAFAAQYIAVERELGLDRTKTNVNGGAIALGHPVGASGARILLSLAYELRRRSGRYGLASLCIGGGQGIAVVIERVE
jgi:acetyl-CoA acyltransferase 2